MQSSSDSSPSDTPQLPDIASRVRLRRADEADAARLSEFAERIFRETFEAGNDPADMAAYLAEAFGADRQRAELVEPGAIVLLAEDATAAGGDATGSNSSTGSNTAPPIVGYSHLTPGGTPDSVHGPDPLELKRFYLDRAWQGSGLARLLMHATLDAARASGARTLWLGVWENNQRAIAFYRKFSFVEAGSHDFMLGRDRQTDLIMARPLTTDTTDTTEAP
jgi:ribosomal protein S18 acetylase RimI-like enzyme